MDPRQAVRMTGTTLLNDGEYCHLQSRAVLTLWRPVAHAHWPLFCALLHIAHQNPVASWLARDTVALILMLVLAGVPVRAADTGPTRTAQVCTIEGNSHPRPLRFAKANVSALGCRPHTITPAR